MKYRRMGDDPEQADGPYRGPGRAAPYPLSRLSAPISLTDAAREIEQADHWIAATTSAKLTVIADQIHALQEQAQSVVEEARRHAALHRAEAQFKRRPGKIYHLYRREPSQLYWSLLSPDDWDGRPPHPFVGSYRLEADQSFTQIFPARDEGASPPQPYQTRAFPGEKP
jgi:hypothetical protein